MRGNSRQLCAERELDGKYDNGSVNRIDNVSSFFTRSRPLLSKGCNLTKAAARGIRRYMQIGVLGRHQRDAERRRQITRRPKKKTDENTVPRVQGKPLDALGFLSLVIRHRKV